MLLIGDNCARETLFHTFVLEHVINCFHSVWELDAAITGEIQTRCHLIVNRLSGSCKHVAGTSIGVYSGECCEVVSDQISMKSNIGEATVDLVGDCHTNRRMCLGLSNIDRACPIHRVPQAVGKKTENPSCPSA